MLNLAHTTKLATCCTLLVANYKLAIQSYHSLTCCHTTGPKSINVFYVKVRAKLEVKRVGRGYCYIAAVIVAVIVVVAAVIVSVIVSVVAVVVYAVAVVMVVVVVVLVVIIAFPRLIYLSGDG